MVHPAEAKRRDQRAAEAVRMRQAASELRAHGAAGDRFAGLDAEAADAVAELIETIAAGAREAVHRGQWDLTRRITEHTLAPPGGPGSGQHFGPLPAGYENPYIEQARRQGRHP